MFTTTPLIDDEVHVDLQLNEVAACALMLLRGAERGGPLDVERTFSSVKGKGERLRGYADVLK